MDEPAKEIEKEQPVKLVSWEWGAWKSSEYNIIKEVLELTCEWGSEDWEITTGFSTMEAMGNGKKKTWVGLRENWRREIGDT